VASPPRRPSARGAPDQRRTFEFEVSAPNGSADQTYPLELETIYEDGDGRTATSTSRFAAVSPLPAQRFRLESSSSTLTVGEAGRLTGRLTNTGNDSVDNAVIVVAGDYPQLDLRQRRTVVGTLAATESAEFSVPIQVDEDAEPGPRQFSVRVEHRGSDDTVVDSPTMDARATVDPESPAFRVEPVDATVAAGDTGHLNLSVTNTATGPATDLTPRLFLSGPLSSPDTEAYIEELGAGESTTLSIPLAASGGAAAKAYPTSLIIKYDDPADVRRSSDTFRQGVEVVAPEDDTGGSGVLPVIGAVVAIAIVGYVLYRRRQ
jgi:hypothetical protein